MAKKKKNIKEETALQQFADFALEMFISIYVFVLLVIYPLYFHNKYYDMGDSKYAFFKAISIMALAALIAAFVLWIIANYKKESFNAIFARYTLTDWSVVAFFAVSYISFCLSENHKMAFNGYGGWNMGLLSQTMFVLLYLFVAKYWKWSPGTILAGLFTACIVYFLAVVMRFGFDPLGMYEGLGLDSIEKFISTLGQTTWYSSYAVLIFPFGIFWYCYDEKLWTRIFSGVFIVLGTMSLCTANSDSAYVAFVVIMMVFFWYSLESNDKFLRFLEVAIMMFASCRLVGLLQDAFPERLVVLLSGEEKISKFVTHSGIMLAGLIIVVALYIAMRLLTEKSQDSKKKNIFDISKFKILRKIMLVAAILVLLLVTVLIILTTNHKLPASLEKLYDVSFMNFDNQWGNHRGFNWRAALTAIKNASFKDILVGVGPDCFALAMDKYCQPAVSNYWSGLTLACAHNEFLNMFVTEGILGVASYLTFMISAFIRAGKVAYKEAAAIPVMAVIVAYIGHNIFCYQQIICTPLLFLFVGVGEVIIKSAKSGDVKAK